MQRRDALRIPKAIRTCRRGRSLISVCDAGMAKAVVRESVRVGKLAHGPFRGRCPRAAPNPLIDSKDRVRITQWNIRATRQGTRVVVLRPCPIGRTQSQASYNQRVKVTCLPFSFKKYYSPRSKIRRDERLPSLALLRRTRRLRAGFCPFFPVSYGWSNAASRKTSSARWRQWRN